MKPFNLDQALAGKKVITRDGREVKEVTFYKTYRGSFPVAGVVTGNLYIYTVEGNFLSGNEQHRHDLFMATEVKTGWINLYKNSNGTYYTGSIVFTEKKKVYSSNDDTLVETIQITWEE